LRGGAIFWARRAAATKILPLPPFRRRFNNRNDTPIFTASSKADERMKQSLLPASNMAAAKRRSSLSSNSTSQKQIMSNTRKTDASAIAARQAPALTINEGHRSIDLMTSTPSHSSTPRIYVTTHEQIVREEMRAISERLLALYQWGVTVLISVQTAIFFLRKDIFERMSLNGQLSKGQYIPWERYLIGTGVLFTIACVFLLLTRILRDRYKFYHVLLQDRDRFPDALPVPPINPIVRFLLLLLFFIFPILDLAIRVTLHFELQIR
jgi:hypothetical protein